MRTISIEQAVEIGFFSSRSIRQQANAIREKYGVGYLLGSSTKIDASNSAGKPYISYIQYLSPANGYSRATNERTASLCPYATKGCEAACLGISAGRMRFTSVQQAQVNRTRLYLKDRKAYFVVLTDEILRAKRKAKRDGLTLSVRLNGTSDIMFEYLGFEIFGVTFRNIFEAFPDVVFYDYTKIPYKYREPALAVSNYSLTYSYNEGEGSLDNAREYLQQGANVSVVYTGNPVKALDTVGLNSRDIVDGDRDDMRFLDPQGSVVLLKAKGGAKRDRSGFVVHA